MINSDNFHSNYSIFFFRIDNLHNSKSDFGNHDREIFRIENGI